jgi:hypothetical protein
MPRHGCWRTLAGCLTILGISLASGCLGFVHPITPLSLEDRTSCDHVPQACKNRVHVFIIHGLDPLDLGNLDGLCDYLHSLGFIKTHFGQAFHGGYFEKEILRIHEAEPMARFAILGFSYGAGVARDLTCQLEKANIPVDLLVYLDGVCIFQRPLDSPHNALRVVNIVAGEVDAGASIADAENVECSNTWHFGAPTNRRTLKVLADELTTVALGVPLIEVLLPPPDFTVPRRPPVLPPPQPGAPPLPPPTPAGAGWNFLGPDGNAVGSPGAKPMSDAWGMESGRTRRP